jgi:hypothetical protein
VQLHQRTAAATRAAYQRTFIAARDSGLRNCTQQNPQSRHISSRTFFKGHCRRRLRAQRNQKTKLEFSQQQQQQQQQQATSSSFICKPWMGRRFHGSEKSCNKSLNPHNNSSNHDNNIRLIKGHYMRRIQSLEKSPNKTKFPHNIQHLGCREIHTNNIKIHKPNRYTETCHPIHDLLSFWSYIHTLNFQKCPETHHQIMIFCS